MAVILNNEIEEALWLDIYKEQMKKTDFPIGDGHKDMYNAVSSQCADDAIAEFRARAGKHSHRHPVHKLTNDNMFQHTHCDEDDN